MIFIVKSSQHCLLLTVNCLLAIKKNCDINIAVRYFGGDEGSRTPVQKACHTNFSECSSLFEDLSRVPYRNKLPLPSPE